mgnify:CR=1 FL=1
MSYLLGIDIGTSGAKALLCDSGGRVIATATSEYPLFTPKPQWSEQNPNDWWRGTQEAIRSVLAQAKVSGSEVKGIGLTGQMHGAVFLDRDNHVIRPALLWNDQRTEAECREITEKVGASRLIEIAGNPALTGFQAPKIVWLRNHEPEAYARLAHVLLPKDYIRLLMTGEYASDASDAAGTLLLDLRNRDWSDEILQKLELDRAWFPKVYEGPEVTGYLKADVAAELGLPANLPVIAGGGDNAAAAVGTGIIRAGVVSSSIGTSGVLFAHSDELAFDPQGRLHTFCHAVPGKYHLMGVTLAAGGAFSWLRKLWSTGLSQQLDYDSMTAEAAQIEPGSEGLLFLPYLTGERAPHLDPRARGGFIGLTSRHERAHMTRSVMEGVTFSLRDSLKIMQQLNVPISDVRPTGGGGRSPLWRQMQADIYKVPLTRLNAEEGPAYGAAILAAVGTGIYANVEEAVDATVVTTEGVEPIAANSARYDRAYAIYRTLYSALRESMHALWEF